MPKLQGFAWHIETVYNPNKIGEKKKKKREKLEIKTSKHGGIIHIRSMDT